MPTSFPQEFETRGRFEWMLESVGEGRSHNQTWEAPADVSFSADPAALQKVWTEIASAAVCVSSQPNYDNYSYNMPVSIQIVV